MHRLYFYLAAFISATSIPVPALAEMAGDPTIAAAESQNRAHVANDAGFYTVLPAVKSDQLIRLIRTYQADLTQQEEAITQYLGENRMDTTDALITLVMPGGLIYAAVKKANLEEARTELTEITKTIDELSRDLLAIMAIQAGTGQLSVAQLQ